MTGVRALALALAVGLALPAPAAAQRGGSRGVRAGSSTRQVVPADPIENAVRAAIAPGLADTTRVRLAEFLARHPRHPRARDAHHELGLLAYARGDYAVARDAFRRARGPGGGEEARYWEALSLFALGRPREARALAAPLSRARTATPRRRDAAALVALSWAEAGRRAEALAAYGALFALPEEKPGDAPALYQAATLARDLGRAEDAATWRARLLREAPGSPEAATVLAEQKAAPAAADSTAARAHRAP